MGCRNRCLSRRIRVDLRVCPPAISALDKGAKVLVMEKGKNYGGCAIVNGGIIALGGGTRTQKEHRRRGTPPEKLYKKLTNPAHHEYRKNTPELVKKYSEWCPGTQVWLEEHGVKFLPTFTRPGKYDSQHHESYHHIWWKDSGEGGRKPQPTGGFMTGRRRRECLTTNISQVKAVRFSWNTKS